MNISHLNYVLLTLGCQIGAVLCIVDKENGPLAFLVVGLVSLVAAQCYRESRELHQLALTAIFFLLVLFGLAYLNIFDERSGYFIWQLALPVMQIAILAKWLRFSVWPLLRKSSSKPGSVYLFSLLLLGILVAFESIPTPTVIPTSFVAWLSFSILKFHILLGIGPHILLATRDAVTMLYTAKSVD